MQPWHQVQGKMWLLIKGHGEQVQQTVHSIVKHKMSKESRKITCNLKPDRSITAVSFTFEQTRAAIKQAKASKAIGPDKISNLLLKHLRKEAIGYLMEIFNLSIKTSQIPQICKCLVIIPMLKPGKDRNDWNYYHPVSLLCPAIRIMEQVILPILEKRLPVPDVLHRFRKMHSTVRVVHDFNQDICYGFNKKKPPLRTILLQLDGRPFKGLLYSLPQQVTGRHTLLQPASWTEMLVQM